MLIQSGMPLIQGDSFTFIKDIVRCGPAKPPSGHLGPPSPSLLYTLITTLEVVVPLFVVTISGCLSIRAIRSTKPNNRGKDKLGIRATVTILLLTATYIILNAPIVVFYMATTVDSFIIPDTQALADFSAAFFGPQVGRDSYAFLHIFSYTLSIPLNSLCNALIWIHRSNSMKNWIKRGLRVIVVRKWKPAIPTVTNVTTPV
eukprot:sb/3470618/